MKHQVEFGQVIDCTFKKYARKQNLEIYNYLIIN